MRNTKEIHLYNNIGNHDKFYDLYYNESTDDWTAYWGRRGTFGQSKDYSTNEATSKFYEKLDKGYEEVAETMGRITYEEHIRDYQWRQ